MNTNTFTTRMHPRSLAHLLLAIGLGVSALLILPQVASATQTIDLDVCTLDGFCNDDSLSVPEGQQIELRWFIDGYEDCRLLADGSVITNIDTSVLPAVGSSLFTPISGVESSFSINCDGVVEAEVVPPPLSVSLEISGSDTKTYDPDLPGVPVRIDWNTTSATRCDPWYMAPVSDPGNQTTLPIQYDNWDVGKTSGRVWFDLPIPYIQDSTIFSITCYNDNTSEVQTRTDTLTVLAAPEPIPISTTLNTNAIFVEYGDDSDDPDNIFRAQRDPVNGYAYVAVYPRVSTQSPYDRRCYYKAYDEDWNPIGNPPGYGTSATNINPDFNVRLEQTTILELVCQRPAVTIGTSTYPADWSTTTTQVDVTDDGNLTLEGDIRQVTVSIDPLPIGDNTTEKSPYTGYAFKQAYVRAENAEYCTFRAERASNGASISLDAWSTGRRDTDASGILDGIWGAPDLQYDVDLIVECQRSFDRNNFPPGSPEYEAAYGEATVRIEVLDPPAFLDEPEVRLYANPYRYSALDIWNSRTANTGFGLTGNTNTRFFGNSPFSYSQRYLWVSNFTVPGPRAITYDFPYPAGEYDVHFAHCDEADGASTYRLLVNGNPIDTYVADAPYQEWDGCGHLEYFYGMLGESVDLAPGDDITLECSPDGGEPCRVNSMVFAQTGDITIDRAPGAMQEQVDIFFNSQYAEACRNQNAFPASGSSYNWTRSENDSWRDVWERETIATTTEFTVECYRNDTSAPATESIVVTMPEFVSFSATVQASAGECRLIPGGPFVTAPIGTIPNLSVPTTDPDYGLCIPAADLGMLPPSASQIAVDNVTGTYDIRALLAITNHGPGALPDTTNVAYYASTELSPSVPYYANFVSRYGDASDESNPAPLFGDGILAPVDPSDYSNPREVTVNDIIFSDVPFGTHELCSRVNIASDYASPSDALVEPDLNPVDGNQDLDNNIPSCTTYELPVPEPPMSLEASPTIVRGGQGATLEWDINVTYRLDCSLNGPGGANAVPDFTTTIDHPSGFHSDNITVGPLNATSEFVFTCTEDLTNTTFTRTATVEVVPDFEEI